MPVFCLLLLASIACTSNGPTDSEVLISLTDEVVVPTYEGVAQDAAQLSRDVEALCANPGGSSLEAARQSWRVARASWAMSRPMAFGPVMDRRSERYVDWSPTNSAGIEALLTDDRTLSAFEVREMLASNLRGFGAIEYLLFRDDTLASADGSESLCPYLTGMTEIVRDETGEIFTDWSVGSGIGTSYSEYFTGRADVAILPDAAVSEVVRNQVFLIREIVDMWLASALGLRGDAPDLTMIPGSAADNGLQDLRNEILGMQAIFEGVGEDGLGISDLIRPLSEETDNRIKEQFTAALTAIDAAEGPLRVALQERPEQVHAVHESLQNLQITISTEVVSLLGVSVGFTDTDGDSLR